LSNLIGLNRLILIDIKNFGTYLYQKKFLDSIRTLVELKYLILELRQFQITQDLIETLSFLKNLKSFFFETQLAINSKFLDFNPLKQVYFNIKYRKRVKLLVLILKLQNMKYFFIYCDISNNESQKLKKHILKYAYLKILLF
jgi:hypothetical protein